MTPEEHEEIMNSYLKPEDPGAFIDWLKLQPPAQWVPGAEHSMPRTTTMQQITITKFICLITLGIAFSGCLPISIVHNADRNNWGTLNLEREKAGLQPLTWEQYHQRGSL
jgi:hypothetical protein